MVNIIREEKWFLGILFLISLIIRSIVFSGYLAHDKKYWQVDSNTYDLVAQGISEGTLRDAFNPEHRIPQDATTLLLGTNGVEASGRAGKFDGKPNFYRLPGYPVFLALYYKLFGVDQKNVLWLQVILASLIPILVFFLSLSLFPTHLLLAKVAACYSTIHLGLVLYAGFFMTETLFIFLFLLFAILFFKSFQLWFCNAIERKNVSVAWIPGQARDDVGSMSSNNDNKLYQRSQESSCVIPCSTGDPGKTHDIIPPNQSMLSFLPEPLTESAEFAKFESMIDDRTFNRSCLIETEEQKNMQRLLLAGFFLGLASLVRPVGQYVIVLACIMLLFSYGNWGDKISRSFAVFLGWIVPVSFWLVRNYMLLGAIFFHTLPGGHFLYLSAARVAMHVKDCSYQEARDQLRMEVNDLIIQQEQNIGRQLNEIERCHVHEKLAIQYFKMRPLLTLKFWMTDMVRTSLSLYSAELLFLESGRQEVDYFKKDRTMWSMFKRYIFPEAAPSWLKIIICIEILLHLLILIGFVASLLYLTPCTWLKVLPFIALFIIIALAGGYARMRLPIEPFLMILSLSFWLSWIGSYKGNVCLKE